MPSAPSAGNRTALTVKLARGWQRGRTSGVQRRPSQTLHAVVEQTPGAAAAVICSIAVAQRRRVDMQPSTSTRQIHPTHLLMSGWPSGCNSPSLCHPPAHRRKASRRRTTKGTKGRRLCRRRTASPCSLSTPHRHLCTCHRRKSTCCCTRIHLWSPLCVNVVCGEHMSWRQSGTVRHERTVPPCCHRTHHRGGGFRQCTPLEARENKGERGRERVEQEYAREKERE